MLQLLRFLLFPISIFYGIAVFVRNYLYDHKLFKTKEFNLPVICIGNLAVGGAGKSPMTEYVAQLLKNKYKLAILSRGYGRKSKGFLYVEAQSLALEVGDEPVQFKHKFPNVTVAVCEGRSLGIELLKPNNQLIILDDAYQHRSVKGGLSILLFDFTSLFEMQWLLPTGNLREPLSQRKRADVLVATKTPKNLTNAEQLRIKNRIKPLPGQCLFFSYLEYGDLVSVYGNNAMPLAELRANYSILLLTGIANTKPLVSRLEENTRDIAHHRYPDHHPFSIKNIAKLAESFAHLENPAKIIVTTEKDAQRLQLPELQELLSGLPVYYLPITAKIHKPGQKEFDQIIENYVAK